MTEIAGWVSPKYANNPRKELFESKRKGNLHQIYPFLVK